MWPVKELNKTKGFMSLITKIWYERVGGLVVVVEYKVSEIQSKGIDRPLNMSQGITIQFLPI